MQTFAILRRNGWGTPDELQEAAARSSAEGEKMNGAVKWIRSYVVAEENGSLGTICIYQADDEDAVRKHAGAAALPATEVLAVADTVIVNPDPATSPA